MATLAIIKEVFPRAEHAKAMGVWAALGGAARKPLDLVGVALSLSGTALVVLGVIRGGETSDWLSIGALGAVAAGLALLGALVAYERRQESPALDVSLFRSAPSTAGTVSISLSFFALTGGTFLLVFYMQLVLGYSPLQLGLVLLPVAVGSVITAIASDAVAYSPARAAPGPPARRSGWR